MPEVAVTTNATNDKIAVIDSRRVRVGLRMGSGRLYRDRDLGVEKVIVYRRREAS